MSEELSIIKCSVSDARELSSVAARAYRDYYLYLWNDDASWYVKRSLSVQQFEKELEDSNCAFYLLKENEQDIGFLKLNLNQPLEGFESEPAMELERIYILKSASRKGFGRRAVEFCFEFAKKMNRKILWLKSMDSSDALHFYEKLGFVICGTYHLDYELMKPEYRGMKILMRKLQQDRS